MTNELKQIRKHRKCYRILFFLRRMITPFMFFMAALYLLTFLISNDNVIKISGLYKYNEILHTVQEKWFETVSKMLTIIIAIFTILAMYTVKSIKKMTPDFDSHQWFYLSKGAGYHEYFPKQAQLLTILELEEKLLNASQGQINDNASAHPTDRKKIKV